VRTDGALALDAIPAALTLRQSAVEALREMQRCHERGLSVACQAIRKARANGRSATPIGFPRTMVSVNLV